jgi:glycosyltransferase involved in cell wall biosynthesis
MAPRVVIVIPTYNRMALVGRAIESALAQTHANLTVVVVDDGSTDGSAAVLADHARDDRVRIVTHERNRGVTAAKNTGLAHLPPDAEWFGILDSDDTLSVDAIEKLLDGHAEPDSFSQIIGWCRDSHTGAPTGKMTHRSGPVTYADALCGRFTGEFWHLARCALLDEIRFEERASGGEGALWWLLMRKAPAWLIPDVVRTYDQAGSDRVGIASYTPRAALGKMWAYRAVIDAVGDDMRAACPRRYAALMADIAKWAAIAGDRATSRRFARAALRHDLTIRGVALFALALLPSALARRLGRLAAWSRSRRPADPG